MRTRRPIAAALGICLLAVATHIPAAAGEAGCARKPRPVALADLTDDERKAVAWLVDHIAKVRSIDVSPEELRAGSGVSVDDVRITVLQPVIFRELTRRGVSVGALMRDGDAIADRDDSSTEEPPTEND